MQVMQHKLLCILVLCKLSHLRISPQNLRSALPLGYPDDEGDGEVVRHVRRAHAKLHQLNNQTVSGKVHHAYPQQHT